MKAVLHLRSVTGRMCVVAAALCASWLATALWAAEIGQPAPTELAAARDVDRLLIVDCLLPGQVRQLGTKLTYLSTRRPVKISADECAIRGGEYVAYDRANLATAINVWMPLAKEGDKQAQTYVGELYERGIGGVAPDYAAAANWYRKAADQGYSRAQMDLGFLYEKGLGVAKDPAQALQLYRKASGLEGMIALDEGAAARAAASEEEIRTLRRELEETRQQLEKSRKELERQKGATQSELQRLEQQKQQALASGDREAARKLEAQLKDRENELAKQRQEVARLEKLAESYRDQLKGMETQSASLRQQLDQAQQQLAKSSKELEERKAKAVEDQRRLDAVKDDLEKARRQQVSSADKDRIRQLEAQLKQREDELARQKREIAQIEQDAGRYKEQVAKLESQRTPPPPRNKDALVAIAPPSIELIDPPVLAMRSPATVKVRGGTATREIVGKVTAPAGLLSFTVNDRSEPVDQSGLFKTTVQIAKTSTPVSLVAVDRRGKRAVLEFALVPEGLAGEMMQAKKSLAPGLDFGKYHALVIGNEKYRHLPQLDTATADATAVADVLAKKYGFKVTLITNATRYQILSELNKLRAKLTEKDNLLIYYAGHGELDRANLRGHWLPVDAEPNSDANWISSVAITDILNAMTVKHVLIVADSCYSGAMTRSSIGQVEPGMSDEARFDWLKALARARCRTVLTSGGVQPVMDGGGGKHSIFARSFLEVLQENQEPLEGQRLYREVAARVLHAAIRFKVEQQPEYAPLKFAGHESGDFIFVPLASMVSAGS